MEFNFNGLLATSYASHFHYNLFFRYERSSFNYKGPNKAILESYRLSFCVLFHGHKEYWLDRLNVPIKAMFSSKKDIKKTIAP